MRNFLLGDSSMAKKSWSTAIPMTPCSELDPYMVWVLRELVCPYAKMVALNPATVLSIMVAAVSRYTCLNKTMLNCTENNIYERIRVQCFQENLLVILHSIVDSVKCPALLAALLNDVGGVQNLESLNNRKLDFVRSGGDLTLGWPFSLAIRSLILTTTLIFSSDADSSILLIINWIEDSFETFPLKLTNSLN